MNERKVAWRPWLRALHRDAGYTAVGLTIIYAASGLAAAGVSTLALDLLRLAPGNAAANRQQWLRLTADGVPDPRHGVPLR